MASAQTDKPTIADSGPSRGSSLYLPLGLDQTRFLLIDPASSLDEEINCELVAVGVEEKAIASYEALSYTWGTEKFSCNIFIFNSLVKVTQNLYEALRHLRDKKEKRALWVDALCINQQDVKERSSQVLLMGRIYSAVRRVVIWLGTEQDGDLQLPMLSKRIEAGSELPPEQTKMAARALFGRRWWYRSWIVQEFLMARERLFVCGSTNLEWRIIDKLCVKVMTRVVYYDLRIFAEYILALERTKNDPRHNTLSRLMLDFGHCQATDFRDKIYSFLSLAKDSFLINPDYTLPVECVYTDLVKRYIEEDGNLEIICQHHRGHRQISLPSWVPDWSICRGVTQNWTSTANKVSFFAAGYLTRQQNRYYYEEGISFEDDQTLLLSGHSIGYINEITPAIDPTLFDTDGWRDAIQSWKPENVDREQYYLTGEREFQAFCRTLVTDYYGIIRCGGSDDEFLRTVKSGIEALFSDPAREIPLNVSGNIRQAAYSSCFAILSSRHFAMVPKASEVGDDVCIFLGASTPMALRRTLSHSSEASLRDKSTVKSDSITYKIIGPCYVHGVMDGEMVDQLSQWSGDRYRIV